MSPFLSCDVEPQRWLADIAQAITMIEDFTAGMDFPAFRSNPMAVAATEHKLQIISEAAIRLGPQAEVLCPGQPWRDIRAWEIAYERIDLETIRNAVTDDLPPFKRGVLVALKEYLDD